MSRVLAYLLPRRVLYWAMIRVGSSIGEDGTFRSNEEVPAVPFTVVVDRLGKGARVPSLRSAGLRS